ncbi:hypothetical protein [Hyphomonas johnsonii]|uniref:Lipoprotein n=1 Tax=Hyphomonas johnsonii MHS-2 TaxID=1280950 RepID=A0A059FSA5_9PROT|nr:hypothetical protein [Hyphomonas johnsonii]KCZ93406.1 hypothetical protein HJO_06105 [Hyphomonas johnsonii MHS-2]
MKAVIKTFAAASAALAILAGTAAAQDYNNWGEISPWGSTMVDEWGNEHYVDPYAYDSQVDMYGNVISSYNGELDPSLDYYDLTPVQPGYDYSGGYGSGGSTSSSDLPYSQPADSHEAFINSIYE